MARRLGAVALVAGLALGAPAADAHSVGARVEADIPAVVLGFSYGDGTRIAFGEVTITDPDGQVHQKGRADRAGRFAVAIPPGMPPGPWLARIDDGQGHRSSLSFSPESPDRADALRARVTGVLGLVAAVMLLGNLVLIAMVAGQPLGRKPERT